MARGSAIEKGKEVEMMKPVAIAAAIALVPRLRRARSRGRGGQAPVIVALGDSLTSGLGLPQDQAFPAQLEARSRRAASRRGSSMPASPATRHGRACAARLGVAGRGERRHHRAWRQRRAARPAARRHEGCACGNHRQGAGEGAADLARWDGGAAQHGQGLCRGVRRDLSRSRGALRRSSSIPSSSTAPRSTTR